MLRVVRHFALSALVLLALAPAAIALPTVSVSSPMFVDAGTSFSVDIMISDVDPTEPLNGFELDVIFDGSVLTATSVVDGGFLLSPTFVVQNSIGAVSVEFAEVTLLPFGASGAGTLATITFDAILPGFSDLDLTNVILSAPFGIQIGVAAVVDGSVRVRDSVNAIPEPSGMLLSAIGLLIVGVRVRRRAG